jgi:arginyl-tRNA synthetase
VTSTYDLLLGRLESAFGALEAGADPVLRHSDRGDYQANGALPLAKRLGRAPREVAEEVLARCDLAGIATAEVAGAGFINLTLAGEHLDAQLRAMALDERLGVAALAPDVVVVDYSAPNVAKEMHVGHLRSTVIGDSLARLHRYGGHRVVARNHVGDWGTPFGMLIEHLIDLGEESATATLSIGDLDGFYRAARATFDADETFRERSRRRVVALQAGDPETRRLWRVLYDQSVAYFTEVYAKLGVSLTADDVRGESAYNEHLAGVVADLQAAGLLVESDGALCVFPPGFVGRDGEPQPLIVQKRDEGFGYAATDLAALRDRVALGASEILYVVGAPQAQHFEMVFAVARLAGWLPEGVNCEHVAFGNVLGPDRKMFKSRAGQSVKLVDLLDEATERARAALVARDPDLDPAQRDALAEVVARAAIKWADLRTDRQRDYVFDLDEMLAFEGDTGPYLQYAHARIRSIFRRAGEGVTSGASAFALAHPAERSLALGLVALPEAVEAALATSQPHRLCTYLFDLAQRLTAFYEACPVLTSEGAVREERLALCDLVGRTLATGLSLLGIEAPERM